MARITMRNSQKATFAEVIEIYISAVTARGVKDKTIATYKQHFHAISKRLDVSIPINQLNSTVLDKMILKMRNAGLSDSSINSYTRTLKCFLSWCNEEGYHDMTNCVMVCYTTTDAIDNAIATFQDLINNNSAMSKDYRYRIVTSQNCLREKALIFKCGLDDRVIEVAKVLLLAHAGQQHPDAVFSEVFFNESDGKFFFEFIGDQYMRAEVPRSFYDNLSESLSDKLPKENTFLVDFAWAKSFIG